MDDPGWCLDAAMGAGSASGAVEVVLQGWWEEYGFCVAAYVLSVVWGLRGHGALGGGMGGACVVCL